jgi:hypothetical protein
MPESNNKVKLKSTPVLLDRAIQGLQQTLLANLPWLDKAYGRGYKMVQHLDNGTKYVYPAAYIGGSEYVSLTPSDNIGNFCWFDIYDPQPIKTDMPGFPTHTYRGALVFWLNLQDIYGTDEFINGEEAKSEILSVITTPGFITSAIGRMSVTEIVEGLDNIYKGYTLEHVYSVRNYAEEDLQSLDKQFFMFPYYGVRFEFEITLRETVPFKTGIVSAPFVKELDITENGDYYITADNPDILLKGVRAHVQVGEVVPSFNIEIDKKEKITKNGEVRIEPTMGYDFLQSVLIDVAVPQQGFDFSGIYSEEQAQELNTYYERGITYAENLKRDWSDPFNISAYFEKNTSLVYLPELSFTNATVFDDVFRYSALQKIHNDYLNLPNAIRITNFAAGTFLRKIIINAPKAVYLNRLFASMPLLEHAEIMSSIENVEDLQAICSSCYALRTLVLRGWKSADIDLSDCEALDFRSVHSLIENAIDADDGAIGRTLFLHERAYDNWVSSRYHSTDMAMLPRKRIAIKVQ